MLKRIILLCLSVLFLISCSKSDEEYVSYIDFAVYEPQVSESVSYSLYKHLATIRRQLEKEGVERMPYVICRESDKPENHWIYFEKDMEYHFILRKRDRLNRAGDVTFTMLVEGNVVYDGDGKVRIFYNPSNPLDYDPSTFIEQSKICVRRSRYHQDLEIHLPYCMASSSLAGNKDKTVFLNKKENKEKMDEWTMWPYR